MKRITALLLMMLALIGCGAQTSGPPAGEMLLQESQHGDIRFSEKSDYWLSSEWEKYDPSVEQVTFWLSNRSGEEIMTGVDYQLETLADNGAWYQIPMVENAGWNAIGLCVPAGGTIALTCSLNMYDYEFSGGGTYRIVKTVEDQVCAAEFRMEEGAAVSAARPYGFAPLEELPAEPNAKDLGKAVILSEESAETLYLVEDFIFKSGVGVNSQLRIAEYDGQRLLSVTDVIYEGFFGDGNYLLRTLRDGSIAEQRFSYLVTDYLVTDGVNIYLSNGADWANAQRADDLVSLLPSGTTEEMCAAVAEQTQARLMGNVTRYQVWSADGVWCAGLSEEPTEFSVSWQKPGEGSAGSMYDLNDWDGLETAITALRWQDDGKLRLTCEAMDGISELLFDPETERLTSADMES